MPFEPVIWDEHLPDEYLEGVIRPVRFERFEEPEADAMKCMGYDGDNECCFYRHQFSLSREILEEDETFIFEEKVYFEEVRAWRLSEGGWLCRTLKREATRDCRKRIVQPVYEVLAARPR